MKELPLIAQVQDQTDSANHYIIREVGSIKHFAHDQIREFPHELKAWLATKERLVPSDYHRVQISLHEHMVQNTGLGVESCVKQHRIEMAEQRQNPGNRLASMPTNQQLD